MTGAKKPISATGRLKQDYLRLKRDPVPYIEAEPLPSNILEWHYVVRGPENTPYDGGMYHGKLVFPKDFPFKPPSIYMITPSGRFRTNTKLCLSMSDFHPDTWNPTWSVSTILTGLLSFMLEKTPTLGGMETSDNEKKQLAYRSLDYNLKDQLFCDLFPQLTGEIQSRIETREKAEAVNKSKVDPPVELLSQSSDQSSPLLTSAFANLIVIVGVTAFVFVVKYVVGTTPME